MQEHLVEQQRDQAALFNFSKQIYGAMQTVLEFMDKGMKGLLTGDMTVPMLLDIQRSIEKYNRKFNTLSAKMNDLVLKQETLDKFLDENFNLEGQFGKEFTKKNIPYYAHTLNNFQDFMVTMDRKDWQRSLQISQNKYFNTNKEDIEKTETYDQKGKAFITVDSKISPANFNDVSNMHAFVEQSQEKFRNKT